MGIQEKHTSAAARRPPNTGIATLVFVTLTALALGGCGTTKTPEEGTQPTAAAAPPVTEQDSPALIAEGQKIFRFDTFGDEQVWTDTLRLHEVVEKNVDPTTALKVGLKVDAGPPGSREVDLKPATTVAAQMNAVVGIQAAGDSNNTSRGLASRARSALTGQLSLARIGHRKDGWPNRDLNVGAIIALSPVLSADKKAVYQSWGPGKYDPRYNQDGKNTPLVLPPAYGLAQVKNETYTAEGPISYWNAYVAVTQMGGQGNFSDPRLGIERQHSPTYYSQTSGAARVPAQPASASPSGRKFR